MPQEPTEVAATQWGSITHYPQWNPLVLKWSPQTRSLAS